MPLNVTINGELTDVSHIDPDTPCCGRCVIIWVWWGPNMVAASRSVALAPCGWTATLPEPVSCLWTSLKVGLSRRWRVLPVTPCTLYSRPGSSTMWRSVAIVRRVRSCRRQRCWRVIRLPLKKILIARWPATFVAAEPICGSEKLFRARPPQSGVASRFLIPAILI